MIKNELFEEKSREVSLARDEEVSLFTLEIYENLSFIRLTL